MSGLVFYLGLFVAAGCSWAATGTPACIDPWPPVVEQGTPLHAGFFQQSPPPWRALHACRLTPLDHALRVESTGMDSYFAAPLNVDAGTDGIWVELEIHTPASGSLEFFWATEAFPQTHAKRARRARVLSGSAPETVRVHLPVAGRMTSVRIDLDEAWDQAEFSKITIYRARIFPLRWTAWKQEANQLKIGIINRSARPVDVSLDHQIFPLEPQAIHKHVMALPPDPYVQRHNLSVQVKGWKTWQRTFIRQNLTPGPDWPTVPGGRDRSRVRVAPDGSGAVWVRDGRPVTVLAPLAQNQSGMLRGTPVVHGNTLSVANGGTRVTLQQTGDVLLLDVQSEAPVEAPVVRVPGLLEQGVLPGLEHLGKGERSSSTLDITTAAHLRYQPQLLQLTQPYMAVCTENTTTTLAWTDTSLQPTFASPDFVDGTSDHRLALHGTAFRAALRVDDGTLEDALLWGLDYSGGFPETSPPRSREDQLALCRQGLDGALRDGLSWGHCAEPSFGRQPYGDHASTWWRLTGDVLPLEKVVPGGAHIPDQVFYFLSGRAKEWLTWVRNRAQAAQARQDALGGFVYRGKPAYREGHFESTASGFCAQQTLDLIPYLRATGDPKTRQALVRSLDYMQRFRTPRGAQTWEVSLHTPDILASGRLVQAYTEGYELCGNKSYLTEARRWAVSGLPFIYSRADYPVMAYATIPVYGATNFRAPLWLGLPVQWCGIVYAYALTGLAPHDASYDWNGVARGILHTGEAMQYPEGPLAGLLPDFFHLAAQQRGGPSINPCLLVGLRLAVEGQAHGLVYAQHDGVHVVSPVPVSFEDKRLIVHAPDGLKGQVLIQGNVQSFTGTAKPVALALP